MEDWKIAHGVSSESATSDNDSFSLLSEYSFDLNPTAHDTLTIQAIKNTTEKIDDDDSTTIMEDRLAYSITIPRQVLPEDTLITLEGRTI